MLIGLDFDATVVKNESPFIGEEIKNCLSTLHQLIANGHELILITMRVDELLVSAISWFAMRDIPIKYINCNPQYETGSRKIYCNLIIDDKGLGIPLVRFDHLKPYVDWVKTEQLLKERGLI